MTKHFLISFRSYMRGLYYRACDTAISHCTRGRNEEQGTFKWKDVDCGNCKRTIAYREDEANA